MTRFFLRYRDTAGRVRYTRPIYPTRARAEMARARYQSEGATSVRIFHDDGKARWRERCNT